MCLWCDYFIFVDCTFEILHSGRPFALLTRIVTKILEGAALLLLFLLSSAFPLTLLCQRNNSICSAVAVLYTLLFIIFVKFPSFPSILFIESIFFVFDKRSLVLIALSISSETLLTSTSLTNRKTNNRLHVFAYVIFSCIFARSFSALCFT